MTNLNRHKTIPTPIRYLINTGLLIALIVVGHIITEGGLFQIGRAQQRIIVEIGIFIILAVSLNLVTGYLGQLPLGHAGFMAVGAYTAGIFWTSGFMPDGASMVVGLILAGIVAAIFGIIIGIPALRLRGDYLAIITLGFGEIIRILITNLSGITGGAQGLQGIPRHSNFILVYICVIIACTLIHMLMKSRHGRAILSIRENEIAAESCGIKTTYYKVMAFTVSAFLAGVAGALFAGNLGILEPASFGFMQSIDILMIVVLGGMGSMAGAVISAAILTSLPLFMQGLNQYRLVIFALMLIVVMIFKPSGLLGTYDFSLSRSLERLINRDYKVKNFVRKLAIPLKRLVIPNAPGRNFLKFTGILYAVVSLSIIAGSIIGMFNIGPLLGVLPSRYPGAWQFFFILNIITGAYGLIVGTLGMLFRKDVGKAKLLRVLAILSIWLLAFKYLVILDGAGLLVVLIALPIELVLPILFKTGAEKNQSAHITSISEAPGKDGGNHGE
ncbi:MAG: branched-chain amino acid ABC transporter permease [Oscillospiraceae bacterium]|nr:branched-chain amino acid ABC transporter permease [Oscillospiraceae bacterium]